MKWRVSFVVPGPPARWERTTEHEGQRKNTAKHKAAKRVIAKYAWVATRQARLKPFAGPVSLSVLAVFPRNLKCPKWTTKEAWATGQRLYMNKDPDWDNIYKLVADAIQPDKARTGQPRPAPFCIHDDNQVCSPGVGSGKVMAAEGEKAHTVVRIEELPLCYSNEMRADARTPDPRMPSTNTGVDDDDK